MDNLARKSELVTVNGVRLHYLDWGGSGPVLLFLAGMGCNAHIFSDFAPRFTDRFHVLALTRRGHGESDHPEAGYDVDTLCEDLLQFLDALKIDKVILAGHSLAGIELSHFAVIHPERVRSLIYLDAAYDRSNDAYKAFIAQNPQRHMTYPSHGVDYYSAEDYFTSVKLDYPALAAIWSPAMQEQSLQEISFTPEGKVIDKMSETIGAALIKGMTDYAPEDAQITCPVLGIFAVHNVSYYACAKWMTEDEKAQVREFFEKVNDPWREGNIETFKRNIPHAKLAILPQGHHYCFIMKADDVYAAMSDFLLENS
ncbi:MAG: alpha/beta fold hydrolase [Anaerolineaceae bacterium]